MRRSSGLRKHIQFHTKVVMAVPLADGKWELELATGEKRIYKGLIVCNGHHWDNSVFRTIRGNLKASGFIRRTTGSPAQLAGKRVLVIGRGETPRAILRRMAARVGKTSRFERAQRLLVSAEDVFRDSFGRDDEAVVIPVWAQRLMIALLLRITVGKYSQYGFSGSRTTRFLRRIRRSIANCSIT